MNLDMQRPYHRHLLQGLGWLCVCLGGIGIVLPIMPTTVFLLIALWAFARSSPRLHTWLLSNRHFGPYIVDWEASGVIPRRAKAMAVVMMSLSLAWLWFGTSAPVYVTMGVAFVLSCVATYILTRPSYPEPTD